MELEDLKIYARAMNLGEDVWEIIGGWSYFHKDSVGKQWIRSVDSVAANISEGYGRYHFKDAKNFAYFSRGSLYETRTWLEKAHNRNLVSNENFLRLSEEIKILGKMLNSYIKSIGNKRDLPEKEPSSTYPNPQMTSDQ